MAHITPAGHPDTVSDNSLLAQRRRGCPRLPIEAPSNTLPPKPCVTGDSDFFKSEVGHHREAQGVFSAVRLGSHDSMRVRNFAFRAGSLGCPLAIPPSHRL